MLYWRGIYKRKWGVLALALVFGIITAVGVSFMTPIYRATVTLMIEQNHAKLISIEDVYSGISPDREHYQTQAELLRSPALAMTVIAKLDLVKHSEFDPRQRKTPRWQTMIPGGTPKGASETWTEERLEAAVVSDFLRRITVDPVPLTQLVKVGFDAADPALAARIANAIAESYIEADLGVRDRMRQQATDWLAERLAELKHNLENSERALQQYREREGLPDMKGLAQSGAARQLDALNTVVNEATEKRIEAEANYRQVRSAEDKAASSPVVLRSTVVDRLKDLEGQAAKRVAELSERYGPEHARMVQAQAELDRMREKTRQAIEQVTKSIAKEYEVTRANERAAQQSVGAAKGSVRHINRKEFQLAALEQDVATNQEIYQKFMNRYRETRAAGAGQNSVVARVIDPAARPGAPYKPRTEQIVAGGVALGLLFGAIVGLMLERLNSTVRSGDEVEEKLGVPVLTVLPRLGGKDADAAGRYYLENPSSVFSEAVRTARTSILLSSIDASSKVLLVTSSVPAEGKSAFAVNLALSHAEAKKTLLIEADLRRPSVVQQLGLDSSKPGLTHLFSGEATFTECLQQVEGSSLYVLPAGPTPENPLELLSSERFRKMIERVAAHCEIVIIDSPPVHLVSDAVLLSTFATGVLFMVKADSTPYATARRCLDRLHDAGAPVVGIALNELDFKKADRYYGAYTGYSKEYGSYYGKQPA
jgi:capsular exopolysaccharide synthesis family protein